MLGYGGWMEGYISCGGLENDMELLVLELVKEELCERVVEVIRVIE